jgi:hypothetical protein
MKTKPLWLIVAAILAAPAPALADPSGFISGGLGVVSYDNEYVSVSGPSANARASGTVELTPTLNLQGDVVLDFRRYNYEEYYQDELDLTGALHLFYREPENYLIGGFIQVTNDRTVDSDSPDNESNSQRWVAGAEAQAYLGDLTLYGQAGFVTESFGGGDAQSGFFGTAQVRYFLTPDFKLDVHGLFTQLSDPDYSDSTLTTSGVGVGVEYKLPESALSVFGTADFLSNQYESGYSETDTRVMVGIKFNFGADSLIDQDRNGTSLDPYPSLPFRIGSPA